MQTKMVRFEAFRRSLNNAGKKLLHDYLVLRAAVLMYSHSFSPHDCLPILAFDLHWDMFISRRQFGQTNTHTYTNTIC